MRPVGKIREDYEAYGKQLRQQRSQALVGAELLRRDAESLADDAQRLKQTIDRVEMMLKGWLPRSHWPKLPKET